MRATTKSSVVSTQLGRTCAGVLVAAALAAGCSAEKPPAPPPPPEVGVVAAIQRDVPVVLELVGQTKGAQDVEIRARVEGYLEDVAFTEGSLVRKGDLLYRIDPKPLQATLATARADLATWQSRFAKTQNDVKRLQPLAAKQAVSQQELDNAVAAQDAARSQVEAQKSVVERATLDLGYTTITSPIDGLVGTTLVKSGNLVGRGESTLLTTVSEIDPILFRAGLSEAEYLRLARKAAELKKDSKTVPVELILADGTVHPQTGRLDAIERAVDAATGTLSLQFKFPNPGGLIRPGQYGRARSVIEEKKGAVLVPQRAVQELQNLHNVMVVGSDNKTALKTVTVGQKVDDLWVVESGLQPGERVVVEGLQRLRPGMTVTPRTAAASPTPAAAPAEKGK